MGWISSLMRIQGKAIAVATTDPQHSEGKRAHLVGNAIERGNLYNESIKI
jgi:hypothetical protein